jgi:imidazolonepropionase
VDGTGDLNVVNAACAALIRDRGGARRGAAQGELDLVRDAAVAIRAGRIVAVGQTAEVLREFGDPNVAQLDATGRTVLPGLVESHCHPVFAGETYGEEADRQSLDEIAGKEAGIMATVLSTGEADDDWLLARLDNLYPRMVRGGASTLEVKSGYGLSVEGELRALRLLRQSESFTPLTLVPTFLGAHMTPADAASPQAYMHTVLEEMLPLVQSEALADFIDVSCDADLFETALVEHLLDRARAIGMPARVHADGWAAADGWKIAAAKGAVAADHLTYTADDQIREVGPTDTIATLLPIAELVYRTDRRANARLLIEQSVPVAIATDYCSTVHSTSLSTTVGFAIPWFGMTPGEAIVGATLNAAYSLNLGHDRGSLDLGKRGDLTLLDCEHPNEAYLSVGAPLVAAVVIGGAVAWSAGSDTRAHSATP